MTVTGVSTTIMLMPDRELLEDVWRRQWAWSRAADRARAEVGRYRVASLSLVVVAAVLGAAAPIVAQVNDGAGRSCGLVAGIALGLIPLVRRRLGAPIYQTWSRLRSVSESLKTEVYTYLAGVAPYRDEDRVRVLRERTTDVLRRGDDLLPMLRDSDHRARAVPAVHDVATYVDVRVAAQIHGYYLPRSVTMARRARQVRTAQTLLAVAAVVIGVLASLGRTSLAPWVGVIGTVSGAVIAHSAAARFGFLQLEYRRAAERLSRLVIEYRLAAAPGPARDDWLVAHCEGVIAYQVKDWMAEFVATTWDETDETIPPVV
jgi:hypothetical protein